MRVVLLALSSGLFLALGVAACAQGREPLDDDDTNNPIDARINNGGDGGGIIDARIDAPGGGSIDAAMQIDAPTGGGVTCPNTIEYNARALDEVLNNPNWVDCLSGADCTSAQCCYEQIVCVAYP